MKKSRIRKGREMKGLENATLVLKGNPKNAIWNKIPHLSSTREDMCPREGQMSRRGLTCVLEDMSILGGHPK